MYLAQDLELPACAPPKDRGWNCWNILRREPGARCLKSRRSTICGRGRRMSWLVTSTSPLRSFAIGNTLLCPVES